MSVLLCGEFYTTHEEPGWTFSSASQQIHSLSDAEGRTIGTFAKPVKANSELVVY